ncbi:MAG: DUF29 family protein, partial [Xenococcaceae cyanobacterium]
EHLLKLKYWQAEQNNNRGHWQGEIANFRKQIKDELEDSPSLRGYLLEILDECYRDGREIATEELEIEICSLGSCTWSREDLLKSIEADECYYIQNESHIRGKMQIDLTVDPPPDLAIEIDISSPSLPRLPIYAALGVPEIWQWNGQQVKLLQLVQGQYVEQTQSLTLPSLKPEDIDYWLQRAQSMGETSWAKAVRRWVQGLDSE